MNAIYKELSDEAFLNIALGGNYFKLAHLDEQLGEIVHHRGCQLFKLDPVGPHMQTRADKVGQQWAHVCADPPMQMHAYFSVDLQGCRMI